MPVFGTGINLEFAIHGTPKGILGQHSLHSQFNDFSRRLCLQLFEIDGLQITAGAKKQR